MIRLAGVTKSFGATRVLDHFDLYIAPGSFVGLLGPSGSGKTTILRLIACGRGSAASASYSRATPCSST